MSNPRYPWWGYVRGMIRQYPALWDEYAALHAQGTTPSYSGMPGGGGEGRPLEAIALRELSGGRQKEYEAVTKAIERTKALPNGEARLAVISFLYWEGRKGYRLMAQAAQMVHYSEETVKMFHREFFYQVAMAYPLPMDESSTHTA